jgi:predicted nuclease with TOPRIM domain
MNNELLSQRNRRIAELEAESARLGEKLEYLRKEALDALTRLSVANNQVAIRDAQIKHLTRERDEALELGKRLRTNLRIERETNAELVEAITQAELALRKRTQPTPVSGEPEIKDR